MKTVKAKLPEGVRKKFIVKLGKKVRVINKDMYEAKKKKELAKKNK